MIRAAREAEIETLREIEKAAGQLFRDLDMHLVADDDPPPPAVLRRFVTAGLAWVVDLDGRPVAYLIADEVDGNLHVEQVSVHPDHARRGHGRALIEYVAEWATGRDYPALTLTTYVDVSWNGPYYLRCGFRFLGDDELTPGLRALRAEEAERGLDRWPRSGMRRDLP